MFELMQELFEILNRAPSPARLDRLRSQGAEIVLDDEGMVEEIIAAERNIAHRLIEEFMLLANETVAAHLDAHDVPSLLSHPRGAGSAQGRGVRGVHLDARLQPRQGVRRKSAPRDFQKLVERMRGTPEEKPIAFLMLRTMQKARYDPSNLGHFGLAARQLHALHVADPAVSRTWSCTARSASRVMAA